MFCKKCGAGNDTDANFCDQCGDQLVENPAVPALDLPKVCPVCNTGNAEGDRFCVNCGTEFEK